MNKITGNYTSVNPSSLQMNSAKMSISEVYSERPGGYLNELTLFSAYFHYIPNSIEEIGIDCKKAAAWFEEKYASEIRDKHFKKSHNAWSNKSEFDDLYYFISTDLMMYFDISSESVIFLFKHTPAEKIEEIIRGVLCFKKRVKKSQPEISLLYQGLGGIETQSLQIKKPRLSIADNYNEDFMPIHQTISKKLSKKNNKGLVLLHGKPGTGKTSYIRYLITRLKKNVIFLPPYLACSITNPGLISILIENPNSIFVIEDAENIIVDREQNENSPVSTLLNISDGLLADCLNIQVICSFNTDLSKIDTALMRKGRLIARYEFRELEVEKARKLSQKLGQPGMIEKPMTLSDIYNRGDMNFEQPKRKRAIGFVTGITRFDEPVTKSA
ncbi:MAG: AAA family ATPase [Bacteroidota bacterium]